MGVLQAFFSFVVDDEDELHHVRAGKQRIAFLARGSLYLVCCAKTEEPPAVLRRQLDYVHSLIVSTLTGGIEKLFQDRPFFDLRHLLEGTERMIDSLVSYLDTDPCGFCGAINTLPLAEPMRREIGNIIQDSRSSSFLYGILTAGHQLVNLVRPRKHVILPADLHLILNFVNSVASFRDTESWVPICLPKFNSTGFLYAYVAFIAPKVCLLMLSLKNDTFYELSKCKDSIVKQMKSIGALEAVENALRSQQCSLRQVNAPGLLDFLYISKITRQLVHPVSAPPYHTPRHRKRLLRLYHRLHQRARHSQMYYYQSDWETVVLVSAENYEFFCTFGPLVTKEKVVAACEHLLHWIKTHESTYFILNSPVY